MRQGYLNYINKLTGIQDKDTVTARDLRDHDKDMDAHKTSLQANATPANKRVYAGTTPPSETDRRIWKNSASSGIWASLAGHLFVRPQDNYLYDITNGKWYNNDAEEIPNPGIALGASAPIVYSLTSDIQEVTDSDPVTFSCVASDPDGVVVKYEWDFGDGAVVQTVENTTTHSYGLDGTYTPKVRAQDNSGLWSSWVTHNTSGVTVIEVELGGNYYGDRGIYAGGGTPVANIDYFPLTGSSGNGSNFGSLTFTRRNHGAVSNVVRGVFSSGYKCTAQTTMDYITISTLSNAQVFGYTITIYIAGPGCVSDGVLGVWAGGTSWGAGLPIEKFTIATNSNTSSFGNLTISRSNMASISYSTRGIFAGGRNTALTVIDYITFNTPSNAIFFGNLTQGRSIVAGIYDLVYGVFCGGDNGSGTSTGNQLNYVDYITIDTLGNATACASLSVASSWNTGASNGTYGFIAGAYGGYNQNQILTMNITTKAQATNFGTLSYSQFWGALTSGSPT